MMTSEPGELQETDLLSLPARRRLVTQYASTGNDGALELHLYYGDKEISFDDPAYFPFGEALGRQDHFKAGDAAGWAPGLGWDVVRDLLQQLVEEGILQRGTVEASDIAFARERSSPLPPAATTQPRSWLDCEQITRELTGHPVELGHLELVVPIFRIAHIAVDADGRQVGEANVFPRALRLDVPTDWLTCIYPGTRHQSDRPMNVTALKAMRAHWKQMMAALIQIRSGFLRRFPGADQRWTVGHIERLATLVLAVPTYQLMHPTRPLANATLHPALSSLFRVTDGLRMVMHQMLFVPVGEPTLPPDAPMTPDAILDYAERNYSFHSETGVCAGPRNMVGEFLQVLIEGKGTEEYQAFPFDQDLRIALSDKEAAFDYGLLGLRAHAAAFSLWPQMARTYEELARLAGSPEAASQPALSRFSSRLQTLMQGMTTGTFLSKEGWRVDREGAYEDMFHWCGVGLGLTAERGVLHDQLEPSACPSAIQNRLTSMLFDHFGGERVRPEVEAISSCLTDFFMRERAVLRLAAQLQAEVNLHMGRPAPRQAFGSREIDIHNVLQGAETRRLPYLLDELETSLGIAVEIDPKEIRLSKAAGFVRSH